jgi:hypothetical protein
MEYCPYVVRRKQAPWKCIIKDDYYTMPDGYTACTRFELKMKNDKYEIFTFERPKLPDMSYGIPGYRVRVINNTVIRENAIIRSTWSDRNEYYIIVEWEEVSRRDIL